MVGTADIDAINDAMVGIVLAVFDERPLVQLAGVAGELTTQRLVVEERMVSLSADYSWNVHVQQEFIELQKSPSVLSMSTSKIPPSSRPHSPPRSSPLQRVCYPPFNPDNILPISLKNNKNKNEDLSKRVKNQHIIDELSAPHPNPVQVSQVQRMRLMRCFIIDRKTMQRQSSRTHSSTSAFQYNVGPSIYVGFS